MGDGRTRFGWRREGAESLGRDAAGTGAEGPARLLLPEGRLSETKGLGAATPKQSVGT